LKLSRQHSRQVARVEGSVLHYYAAHSEHCIRSSTATAAATTAWQPQCQTFKRNNQPEMFALIEAKAWDWENHSAASKRASKKSTDSCIGKAVRPQQQSKSREEAATR